MKNISVLLILFSCLLFSVNSQSQRLRTCDKKKLHSPITNKISIYYVLIERYNVNPATVTVSGISAGAAMATQYHFAHSTEVFGVGMVAGR